MERSAAALLSGIPLFSGIEEDGMEAIARIFQPVTFAAGAVLVRQGQPADGAYAIESGRVEVLTALPGGGELTVATLGAGSVLGEMALLERGVRSATVVARDPVTGHFIEREPFRVLLAQRNRAAFVLQNRIALLLCQRLRDLNARIVASEVLDKPAPPLSETAADAAPAPGACSFEWRRFLPLLPLFSRFNSADLDAFAGMTQVVEFARGHRIFREGDESGICYVVVRGAIEITGTRDGQRHRIGILGPGRLCGILAAIEGQRHSMSAVIRERAALLEIGPAASERLFRGSDRLAALFQEMVNRELLQALARTNNHLTRLASQSRIRGGRRRVHEADELQRALGGQDCRPAGG